MADADSYTANCSSVQAPVSCSRSEASGSAAADDALVVGLNLSLASAVADAWKLAVQSDGDKDDGRAAAVSRASSGEASTDDANAVPPKTMHEAFEIGVAAAVRRGSVEAAWTAGS